jgi:hypothetical protein
VTNEDAAKRPVASVDFVIRKVSMIHRAMVVSATKLSLRIPSVTEGFATNQTPRNRNVTVEPVAKKKQKLRGKNLVSEDYANLRVIWNRLWTVRTKEANRSNSKAAAKKANAAIG